MTSRRSRLKAVTNLPVRRKPSNVPGNGNEGSLVENIKSEKVITSDLISDKDVTPTENTNLNSPTENNANSFPQDDVSSAPVNCGVIVNNNQNSVSEYVCNKNNEVNSGNLESTNDLSSSFDLSGFKSESSFKSIKRFKPNLTLSLKEKSQGRTSKNNTESESLEEPKCLKNNNNNNNNYNDDDKNVNSIVEENFKCYTILSPSNVTLSGLTEYTLTPLTPCTSGCNVPEGEITLEDEFEEVQIFTEVESTELYENTDNVNDDCDSVIDCESIEPVLTNVTNCNSGHVRKDLNFTNSPSNYVESRNTLENIFIQPNTKFKTGNVKTNFSGLEEQLTNNVTQVRETNIVDGRVPSGVSNISSDLSTLKRSTTGVRRKRNKCNDLTKKLADAKKEFQRKYEKIKPDRSTLKMIDLIFYNPTTNPMESKSKFDKKGIPASPSNDIQDLLEENVDDPEGLDCVSPGFSDKSEAENASKMPVPQVKIGLDGEIILDEKSLIIETTDAKKRREHLQNSLPIFEDRGSKVSYYRGKNRKKRDWSDFETKRFYKALNTIGPDFSLMQKYFPRRSRLELKNKFKREERLNRHLIDKALNNPSEFDMTQLEKDLAVEKEAEEEQIEMRLCRVVKQTPRKPRVKSSLLSREMTESDGESENSQSKPVSVNCKTLFETEKNKKEKEFDFVFQKLLIKESEKNTRNVLPEISSFKKAFRHSDHGLT